MIAAAEVSKNVPNSAEIPMSTIEHVAKLTPDQQVDFAQSHDISEMTSRQVEKAVKEYKQRINTLRTLA